MDLLELYRLTGLKCSKVSSSKGGVYQGPCPKCGGKDRFSLYPGHKGKRCFGSYICSRHCGIHGDSISFLVDVLNYSFQDALKLAEGVNPLSLKNLETTRMPHKSPTIDYNDTWSTNIAPIVQKSNTELYTHLEERALLFHRGIDDNLLSEFKVGYNPYDMTLKGEKFGCKEDIWFPRGFVIPVWENGKIIRVKIRSHPQGERKKFYEVKGGSKKLVFTPFYKDFKEVFICESELDGYLLHSYLRDDAHVLPLGTNYIGRDNPILEALSNKKLYIVHDNDEGGEKMLQRFKILFPECVPFPSPAGRDPGIAWMKNLNFYDWLNSR